MKIILYTFLNLFISQTFSQSKLPIVYSNTKNVRIIENKEIITSWNLDPNSKPDIYVTGKINKSQNLKLVTDIDSLEINLKPNENFDFVVLYNNIDSCYTKFKSYISPISSKLKPKLTEKIPFVLTPYNNIKVKSVLNQKDTLSLHFDTGASDFYLTKAAIRKYIKPKNENFTMQDISNNSFSIGNLNWNHQQIYPNDLTAQQNEGLFGWNLFDGKILEVNYDSNQMTVYSKLPKISKEYEKFEIQYMRDQFRIVIAFEIDGERYSDQFLFDTGFQKASMLDNDLLIKNKVATDKIETLKTTILRNSRNEEIPLKTVKIDKFIFGKYTIQNVPSELNTYNKPTGYSTHFLGSDIIKRFNLIFDFQKNIVFLKPNKNFKNKFYDEQHKS